MIAQNYNYMAFVFIEIIGKLYDLRGPEARR
jgi:hypothetical protein